MRKRRERALKAGTRVRIVTSAGGLLRGLIGTVLYDVEASHAAVLRLDDGRQNVVAGTDELAVLRDQTRRETAAE